MSRLRTHGRERWGIVTGVEFQANRSAYLTVLWRNPKTGVVHKFRSDASMATATGVRPGNWVRLILDPRNPDKWYWVDSESAGADPWTYQKDLPPGIVDEQAQRETLPGPDRNAPHPPSWVPKGLPTVFISRTKELQRRLIGIAGALISAYVTFGFVLELAFADVELTSSSILEQGLVGESPFLWSALAAVVCSLFALRCQKNLRRIARTELRAVESWLVPGAIELAASIREGTESFEDEEPTYDVRVRIHVSWTHPQTGRAYSLASSQVRNSVSAQVLEALSSSSAPAQVFVDPADPTGSYWIDIDLWLNTARANIENRAS